MLRTWGEPPQFTFSVKDATDLGGPTGWIDMARGARLSGSRFAYRFGDVAMTEMALYRFVLDRLAGKGFMTVLPPVLVGERAMYGTGFLPTEESNLYHLERDNLYLTGTSEVALAGIHTDERLEESELPAKYAAFTTNFRREAGAAGKDTKGMFRVHQFDKVEMYVYCLPEQSSAFHEELLAHEEEIVQALGLPYRVMNIAVGDLGAPAAKKYDIEAWFPAQERYREITSCSNTTDYQARRLNIRFRRDGKLALRAHPERNRCDGPVPPVDHGELPGRGGSRGRPGGAAELRSPGHPRPEAGLSPGYRPAPPAGSRAGHCRTPPACGRRPAW